MRKKEGWNEYLAFSGKGEGKAPSEKGRGPKKGHQDEGEKWTRWETPETRSKIIRESSR